MVDCNGAALASVGTAVAAALAAGLSADEKNILGALFNVIGDQLSLMAATEAACGGNATEKAADTNQIAGPGKENTAGIALLPDAVHKF